MKEITVKIEGMTCEHCEGVSHVEVSLQEGTAKIGMEQDLPLHVIKSAVEEWGYSVVGEV